MQFNRDIELCMRNKWKIRGFPEPRRSEILDFFHRFRLSWHLLRRGSFPRSAEWLKRREAKQKEKIYGPIVHIP